MRTHVCVCMCACVCAYMNVVCAYINIGKCMHVYNTYS